MMFLDDERVAQKRVADPHGRKSTGYLETEVAQEQVIEALRGMLGNQMDPHVERLHEILLFAFEQGVI